MLASPWLPIPPQGYGGTENVIYALVPELRKLGVQVELFTVGESTLRSDKKYWLYKTGQYQYIHAPFYESAPVAIAHIAYALNIIKRRGDFDIIHDHNNFLGAAMLADSSEDLPPAVQTLHNPHFINSPSDLENGSLTYELMWQQLARSKKLYFVAMSRSLTAQAPRALKPLLLPPVHNAVTLRDFPFVRDKEDYFITLARFHPEKGQDIAVKACTELHYKLKMAGVVGDIRSSRKILMELANPLSLYRSLPDFRYFSDQIFPHLNDTIEYVGEVKGEQKLRFISRARALLFPIKWEEPFGMAVVEALACGTPVVAMDKGAMPEIIEHGVNGFLAHTPAEFKKYMRLVDEIDPAACRQSVKEKFSAPVMARQYLERYRAALAR